MDALKWFYGFFKPVVSKYVLGLFLVTLTIMLAFVNPYVTGVLIEDVVQNGHYEIFWPLVITMITATLVRSIIRWNFLIIFEENSQKVLFSMRDFVYRNFMLQDFNFFSRNRTGDLLARQIGDMDAIRHILATLYAIYESVMLFVIALIMCFTVNKELALIIVCVLPFTFLLSIAQFLKTRPAFAKIRDCFSSLNSYVQENISGNRVVRAFAKEEYELEKFSVENRAYQQSQAEATKIWSNFIPTFEFLTNLLSVVLLYFGGTMVIEGTMSLGELVIVTGYLWMLNQPLRMAGWQINDIQKFLTSLEKIYSTVSVMPKISAPSNAVKNDEFKGNIEFKNVTYTPEDDDTFHMLKNVSFTINQGETVGIIGSTGSGKSTIVNLLSRFYDAKDGEILIDGIPIKEIDLQWLRGNIGMAMQDVFLFSDTIEGNIAYGDSKCPFEKVVWAASMAGAHNFIKDLPEGYDTIVGERGVGLSGGQKQRVSLARALLKKTPVLILDDTTSALDIETEHDVKTNLKSLNEDLTKIIIAYRISAIKDADKIIVLEKGKIVEIGNHDDLIKKQGYYNSIYEHQYGDFSKINNIDMSK